ncbi:MAG: 6-bladed beta-propeller [Balneolaceae bacterium]
MVILVRSLVLLVIFIVSCSVEENEDTSVEVHEIEAEMIHLLITSESSSDIVSPAEIKGVTGGFLLYDSGLQKIFKFDSDGNQLFEFGSAGDGPGEIGEFFGFWEVESGYLVYDRSNAKFIKYDLQGNLLEDILIEFDDFPLLPVKIEVIDLHQIIVPTHGREESLLTFVDLEYNDTYSVGEAVGEYVSTIDPEEMHQAITSGRIPAFMQNIVMVSSNSTGVFSFQQTTAILEKFSSSGELIWQKNLKIPAIDGLFNHIFSENRRRITTGEFLLSFNYGIDISANEEGVAVLLNMLEDQPVRVVWIPNNGEKITTFHFQSLENERQMTFTLSDDGSHAFFVNTLEGTIYKTDLPL